MGGANIREVVLTFLLYAFFNVFLNEWNSWGLQVGQRAAASGHASVCARRGGRPRQTPGL